MKLKNLSVATALLLALTGCGSGGGSNNSPNANTTINNDQTTQAQLKKQKAELQALKDQLSQAQANQKQAEEKLKSAEKTHNQDLTNAKNNLATAQGNLSKTQLALKQAEEKLAVAQQNNKDYTELQNQLNEAAQKLSLAQQEKLQAEKALNDKLAEENKPMSRAEVLDFALHNGLHTVDSEEFADDFQNKPKSFVIDQLIYTHKIIVMKNLARRYGLPEADVRVFTKANKNKTLEEAATLLENKRDEIEQKRTALRNELLAIAKEKGLEDWEANNFVYGREHTDKDKALEDLNNYLIEKAERETKRNELVQLAKEKGLEDWEAQNFAHSNIDNDRSSALETLNQLAAEKEKQRAEQAERETKLNELVQLAKERGLEDWEAQNFANQNIDNNKSSALETLNQLAAEKEKQRAEQEKERLQAQKEEQMRELAENYKNTYFPNVHHFDTWGFAQKNKDKSLEEAKTELEQHKTNREKITELAKILTELNVDSYYIEQFIDQNTLVSLEEAQINLDKKVDEAIINLKGTGDKPLGFLTKQDHSIRNEPIIENDREVANKTVTTYDDIYNQKYSVITGHYNKTVEPYTEIEYYYEEGDNKNSPPFRSREVSKTRISETYTVDDGSYPYTTNGFRTTVDKFPSEGIATYTGIAFDAKAQGQLSYTVNFAERKGSGKITGLDHIGDITLQEAEIYKSASHNSMRVKGNAIAEAWNDQGGVTGEYAANFFGPNAEEIAGKASLSQGTYKWIEGSSEPMPLDRYIRDVTIERINDSSQDGSPRGNIDIGFGGTRGEIQK